MRKQDFLIHLIRSLSPNESRHFKLFSSIQTGEKEYVKLFETLQNKTEYDVQALSKEIGITPAQLAERKHYLCQILIKSLQNYEEQTSDIAAVYRAKEEAVTLLGRRLFEFSLDHINKALARAWELELFELITEMLLTKYGCLFGLGRYSEISEIAAYNKKAALALAEMLEIYDLRAKATDYHQGINKTAEFKLLMQHPLLKAPVEKLKSLKAQIAWFHIYSCYLAIDKTNAPGFLKLAKAEVAYYKKKDIVKIINPVAYFVSHIRLAEAESQVGNYEGALQTCENLNTILKPSAQISKVRVESLMSYTHGLMITQFRHLKKYKEALAGLEKMESQIMLRQVHEICNYNFNYAVVLFNLKKSAEAIDKIEEILKTKEDATPDLLPYIRPLAIVAQLDLDNYQLIPHLIKSTKSWMKRQKVSLPELEIFFSLTYAIATASAPQRRQRWLKLKEATDGGKFKLLDKEFNMKSWLERKLTRLA